MNRMDFDIYPVITEKYCRNNSSIKTLKELVKAGIKIVQLREKEYSKKKILDMAYKFREITYRHNVVLIINDYIDIALSVSADGVHLGQDDLPCYAARKIAPDLIIGVSTHNLREALEAQRNGATYINIGPIFPTRTKETFCRPVGVKMIKTISSKINIPFTVMGGIKEENIQQVIKAGAKRVAMITEITLAENIPLKVQKLVRVGR